MAAKKVGRLKNLKKTDYYSKFKSKKDCPTFAEFLR